LSSENLLPGMTTDIGQAEDVEKHRRRRMLKAIHVPYTFAPNPGGGTEIYVEALAHELGSCGVESLIVAPSSSDLDESYNHQGLRVRRYREGRKSRSMLREIYGSGSVEAAAGFAQILDEERPDLIHIHAFTRAVSVLLVQAAKQRGLPVFFTYHTPTVSCQRGTLMVFGKQACDGALDVERCSNCSLHGLGIPIGAAKLVNLQPKIVSDLLEAMNLQGRVFTALRMPELIGVRQRSFLTLMQDVDKVIALSQWVRELLLCNGVPDSKIVTCPHGLPAGVVANEPQIDIKQLPLRVAFLGRADPVKGPDTLIKAIRSLPGLDIELHLYGVIQSEGNNAFWKSLKRLAEGDRRIAFMPAVPHDEIVSLLRRYHVLAVPSRWLETGPLVILESFFAGTPVIASRLGGIAEKVKEGHNGLLLPLDDIPAWADALYRCAHDRDLLSTLRNGAISHRSMADVAREMAQLYRVVELSRC
jgi:glycosyltransferase involved in cell wall biosynthesis